MKIEHIIEFFKNLNFKVENFNKIGYAIKVSEIDGFIFSAITGAQYLINDVGVTMKGRNEVFIHRSVFQKGMYIYSPGLYGRDINMNLLEENSAPGLLNKYPEVFSGEKYILPVHISSKEFSNIEYRVFNSLLNNGYNPANFILFKVFESESCLEPFFEYLTAVYFLSLGYFVENQVPWFQQSYEYCGKKLTGGIPDFSAFHSDVSNIFYQYGLIENNRGLILNIIPVLMNFKFYKDILIKTHDKNKIVNKKDFSYYLAIGEVKSNKFSLLQALKQLEKYKSVNLANDLFTIIPDVKNNSIEYFGEIYCEDFKLRHNKAESNFKIDETQQTIDSEWISNYIKFLLTGNLYLNEIYELINEYRGDNRLMSLKNYESRHLIDMVINTTTETILDKLMKE